MIIGRICGWVVTAVALMVAGAEILASLEAGAYQGLEIGSIWYKIDSNSLLLSQAAIQRHIHPALWDPIIATLLQWPAWITFGTLGPIITLTFRRRDRHSTTLNID